MIRVRRDEEGSALVLALVFLSLFGLAIAAVLGQVDANMRTTLAVREHEAKVYGADAGIDYAIQALQVDDTLCPDAEAGAQAITPTLPLSTGTPVTVTCQTTDGSVLGVRGYAVVTTEPKGTGNTSLDTSNGSISRTIEGPVYVVGDVDLDKPVTIKQANFIQQSPCQATPIDDLTITPSPPFAVRCATSGEPDEPHQLPAFPAATQPAAGDGGATCRTFHPGVYATAPALAARNFFASGVYYFGDIGDWTITEELFGGMPRPDDGEPKVLSETPCIGADPTPAPASGVLFVLGGSSRMIVGNGAHIELFSANAAASGTGNAGFSIRSVLAEDHAADSRWKVSAPGTIVDVSGGNTRDFAVHGLVYTPKNAVNLFVTGSGVDAQLQGGAKVSRLGLATSNSGTGLRVSTKRGGGRRVVTLISRAVVPGSARVVEARAVVEIANDELRTVTVRSQSLQHETL